MEIGWPTLAGAALVGGGLCYWVWRARRAGAAPDSLSGYLIGDQVGGDVGGHHHHHIVCEQCGRVVAFEDEGLEKAILALAERPDFDVSSHDVTLRGECGTCRARSV